MEGEGRNLPTPPLVRTTRGSCAERFYGEKMRRIARKGFWIEFTARRAAVERAEGPRGPGEMILTRGESASGVFVILDEGWRSWPLREKCSAGTTFYFLPHPVHSFCWNSESEVILALEKYHKINVNYNYSDNNNYIYMYI